MKCILCGKNTDFLLTTILRGNLKGKVYFCKSCELGMLKNHKNKDYYKSKYRKDPLHKQTDSPKELFDLYSNFQYDRINLLKKYLNRNTALLEVGCSVGMFLYNVRKYTKKIIGIDYDLASGEFAADKCRCLIFNEDIESTWLHKGSFDIICVFQTLEHVEDPIGFISQYKEYLKPNGLICIEVPNINDSLRYVYNLPNHSKFYFHSAHLWYFSKKSLNILMKKSGFTGNIIFTQSYNMLNHLHWIDTDMPQKSCVLGLSLASLPIRNGLNDKIGKQLNDFILSMDLSYRELLSSLEITDNITYIGKKNG